MQRLVKGSLRLCSSSATHSGVPRSAKSVANTQTTPVNRFQSAALRQSWARSFSTSSRLFQAGENSSAPQTVSADTVRYVQTTLPEDKITQESMLVPVSALKPLPDSFAVISIGGKQFRVTQGDTIMIEKIDAPLQSRILLDKILLVGTRTFSAVGQPLLTNVKVHAEVEEQTKSAKVIIFKAKRRKGYKKHRGHRQPYTLIRILDVMVKEH